MWQARSLSSLLSFSFPRSLFLFLPHPRHFFDGRVLVVGELRTSPQSNHWLPKPQSPILHHPSTLPSPIVRRTTIMGPWLLGAFFGDLVVGSPRSRLQTIKLKLLFSLMTISRDQCACFRVTLIVQFEPLIIYLGQLVMNKEVMSPNLYS